MSDEESEDWKRERLDECLDEDKLEGRNCLIFAELEIEEEERKCLLCSFELVERTFTVGRFRKKKERLKSGEG